MKKETKITIAAISAAAVAATITAAVTTVKVFSDMAIKKEIPKVVKPLKNVISGNKEVALELSDIADEQSRALKELATEKVTITNRDGLKLTGYWYRNSCPRRIVIAMHGWRSNWSMDFSLCAEFLHKNGCSILFPDQRCHGESEGDHIGFGVFERYDLADWIDYVVKTEGDNLPIYLLGVSMGATTVLMASDLDLPSCVKGIISDCAFTSPNDIWHHVMKNNLKVNSKLAFQMANYYIIKEAKLDGKSASTVDCVANTKIPILFVHGDSDSFVPVEMTKQNYEACNSEKKMLIVNGAEHGLSFYVDEISYKMAVFDFFGKYDK